MDGFIHVGVPFVDWSYSSWFIIIFDVVILLFLPVSQAIVNSGQKVSKDMFDGYIVASSWMVGVLD